MGFIFCNLSFLILVVQVTVVSFKINRRKHETSENNSCSLSYYNHFKIKLIACFSHWLDMAPGESNLNLSNFLRQNWGRWVFTQSVNLLNLQASQKICCYSCMRHQDCYGDPENFYLFSLAPVTVSHWYVPDSQLLISFFIDYPFPYVRIGWHASLNNI